MTTPLIKTSITLTDKSSPLPLGAYSHLMIVGQWVYLSGIGCRDPKTNKEVGVTIALDGSVNTYDIEAQTHGVIKNLIATLKHVNCTLADLVDVQVFLADMDDFEIYNRVYADYFSFPNPPTRTTIEAKPPGKNFIEIKALALKPVETTV